MNLKNNIKMKPSKVLTVFFISALFVGCKNNNDNNDATKVLDSIVKDEAIDEVPYKSDDYFDKAIKAYEANNKNEASKYIDKGVEALHAESKDLLGLNKLSLENSIDQLENISGRLDDNEDISLEGFKDAVVNAELNIAHEYLSPTEGVYMLVKPENVSSAKTKRNFSAMISNLKQEEGNMKKEAKKENEDLVKEGEQLKKELANWEAKAKEYSKKTNEHFKVFYPDENYRDLDL